MVCTQIQHARHTCKARHRRALSQQLLVVGSLNDQVIDDAVRFFDVMKGATPKTPHGRVIFFLGDVIVSFI
jgi:hypothetical protein